MYTPEGQVVIETDDRQALARGVAVFIIIIVTHFLQPRLAGFIYDGEKSKRLSSPRKHRRKNTPILETETHNALFDESVEYYSHTMAM